MPATTVNGIRLHYEDEGRGEALVLLHGAAGSAKGFASMIPPLAREFRVIAPDYRGLGRSEHVQEMPPSAWNDDLVALLNQLGVESAHVLGRSLGARVAMRFAIDHPRRARSLVVDVPIIANDPAGNAALNANFGGTMSAEMAATHQDQHGDDWREVVAWYGRVRNMPELQEFYGLRDLVGRITCPTFITRGDVDDAVHPLAHSFEIHAKVRGSWMWIAPNTQGSPITAHFDEFLGKYREFVSAARTAPVPA